MTRTASNVDGLDVVVIKCIEIAQKLLEMGFLVRGGISVGSVWHTDTNIFGSGYIDAYKTEQKARHPRIALSPKASEAWKAGYRIVPDLCLADADCECVDVLHPYYLRTNEHGIPYENSFRQFSAHILQNLSTLPLGSDSRSKWEWMAGFFNSAIRRHQVNVPEFSQFPLP